MPKKRSTAIGCESKVEPDTCKQIRRAKAQGKTFVQIAQEFNISAATAHNIVNFKAAYRD